MIYEEHKTGTTTGANVAGTTVHQTQTQPNDFDSHKEYRKDPHTPRTSATADTHGTHGGTGNAKIERVRDRTKYFIANHRGSSLVVFVAGLVLLCASSIDVHDMKEETSNQRERTGYRFGVAVGCMGMFFALIYYAFALMNDSEKKFHGFRFIIALTLVIVWGAGLFWLTFGAAYDETGNAFFSLWVGFLFSFWLLTSETTILTGVAHRFRDFGWELAAFLLFSVTLAIASISWCVDNDECEEEPLFGLITGCVSACFALVMFGLAPRLPYVVNLLSYLLFFVWWVIAAFILTFRRPFEQTGNGYFSSWGGVISISLLTARVLNIGPETKDSYSDRGHNMA